MAAIRNGAFAPKAWGRSCLRLVERTATAIFLFAWIRVIRGTAISTTDFLLGFVLCKILCGLLMPAGASAFRIRG